MLSQSTTLLYVMPISDGFIPAKSKASEDMYASPSLVVLRSSSIETSLVTLKSVNLFLCQSSNFLDLELENRDDEEDGNENENENEIGPTWGISCPPNLPRPDAYIDQDGVSCDKCGSPFVNGSCSNPACKVGLEDGIWHGC